jgi:Cys-Gly metallodipeptidase DUG1
MTDLIILFSKLVTPDGKILIPGINDDVAELTGKNFLFFLYLINK